MGAGSELVGSVLAGFVIGWFVDKKLGTSPWLTLLGAVAGISFGLYQLIRIFTPPKRGDGDTRGR